MLSSVGPKIPSLSISEWFGNVKKNTSFGFPKLWGTEMNLLVYVSIHCVIIEREIIMKSDSIP